MEVMTGFLNRKDIPVDVRKAIQKEFSKRKKVEETLQKHIQMIDFADDTIMIRSLSDRIIYWNQGAVRLYGWNKDEALGKHVHTFLKTKFPVSWREAVRTCLKTGYWEGELMHRKRDGASVTVASRWTLQKDEREKPIAFLEINNDITKLKETQEELNRAHEDLEERVVERTSQLRSANQELKTVIRERGRLEKEILEISSKEQRRIGQDLHDGLSQHLTGIAFLGKVLEQKLSNKSAPEMNEAHKIVELVNEAISQTKGLAQGLYPVELESNGLVAALQELAVNTEKLFGVLCYFKCDHQIYIHDRVFLNHLFRIAQEAVNNTVKHSGSKQIWINLSREKDRIVLEVKDEGVGIKLPRRFYKGMGLRIMNYRAEMINALLDVQKGKQGGTVVRCSFKADLLRKGKRIKK